MSYVAVGHTLTSTHAVIQSSVAEYTPLWSSGTICILQPGTAGVNVVNVDEPEVSGNCFLHLAWNDGLADFPSTPIWPRMVVIMDAFEAVMAFHYFLLEHHGLNFEKFARKYHRSRINISKNHALSSDLCARRR